MPNSAYFESVRTGEARPHILLLSRHFPPSEEAGALRWQKIASGVARRGWGMDVITLAPAELTGRDDRRLEELPADTRVFGVPTRRLFRDRASAVVSVAKRLGGRRSDGRGASRPEASSPARPDSVGRHEATGALASYAGLRRWYHASSWRAAELAWARDVERLARRLITQKAPLAIVTCGPPHQIHLVGERLSRRVGIPHVMDMRDPWSLVERIPEAFGSTSFWTQAESDERRCIAKAALIVVNTEKHRRALQLIHPDAASRIIAVLNGFDDEKVRASPPTDVFTIAYAGTIYLDRDPRPLLQAVANLIQRRGLAPGQLRLVFMGEIEAYGSLEAMAADAGIASFVDILGRKPRREALEELARADVLVVLPQDSHLAVPSKVYEYMLFPAWILALAYPESSIADTLAGTGADVVEPLDVAAMSEVLIRRFDDKRETGRPTPIAAGVPYLSRSAQGALLLDAIAELPTNGTGASPPSSA